MPENYSREIASRIETWLESNEWKFEPANENGVIHLGITLRCKLKSVVVYICVGESSFSVFTVFPLEADKDNISAVSEFLMRINSMVSHGNFEVSYKSGEVHYRATLICADNMPTTDQIEWVFDLGPSMSEKFGDAFIKVYYGAASAEEALADI